MNESNNTTPAGSKEEKQHEQAQDCFTCRVTGTAVCIGTGAYLALQTYARPPLSPVQKAITLSLAGGLGFLGLWRATIWWTQPEYRIFSVYDLHVCVSLSFTSRHIALVGNWREHVEFCFPIHILYAGTLNVLDIVCCIHWHQFW